MIKQFRLTRTYLIIAETKKEAEDIIQNCENEIDFLEEEKLEEIKQENL